MIVYDCNLELQDNLFFSSREYGSLYECINYIHNYALTYAISLCLSNEENIKDFLPLQDYFCKPNKKATYREDLDTFDLFYVTPAKPVNYESEINSINCGESDFFIKFGIGQKSQNLKRSFGFDGKRNKPAYSKIKEISVSSIFQFFIISKNKISIPKWIRLGKWLSKCEIEVTKEHIINDDNIKKDSNYFVNQPLNKDDTLKNNILINIPDIISMPPSILINNAMLKGDYIEFESNNKNICLPAGLKYRF